MAQSALLLLCNEQHNHIMRRNMRKLNYKQINIKRKR